MYIALVILCFLLLWVLMAPVQIMVDSERSTLLIRQPGTFRFLLLFGMPLTMKLHVFGFPVPMKTNAASERRPPEGKQSSWRAKKSARAWWLLVRRVVGAFRLKTLEVDVDTDDVVLNAQLIPVALGLESLIQNGRITTNNAGRCLFLMDARMSVGKMMGAVILLTLNK